MPVFNSVLVPLAGYPHKAYRVSVTLEGKEAGSARLYEDDANAWIMEAYAINAAHQGKGLSYALTLIMLREIGKRGGTSVSVPGAHGNMIGVFTRLGFAESNRAADPTSGQIQAKFQTANIRTALQQCEIVVGTKNLTEKSTGCCSCCYITTAVCDSLGLPDDCDELNALRLFRDSVLLKSTSGTLDVLKYYSIAPDIVAAINLRQDASAIYADLNQRYILPAVAALAAGDYVLPHALFKKMTAETQLAYLASNESGDDPLRIV